MKDGKRLVRGLKDISSFFMASAAGLSQSALTSVPVPQANIETKEPISTDMLGHMECLTILPHTSQLRLLNHAGFVRGLHHVFEQVNLLSFSTNRTSDLPVPDNVRQLILPPFQLQDVLHPEPLNHHETPVLFQGEKRCCFFLEPKVILERHPELLEMLDHVILSAWGPSADSLMSAYQHLSLCVHRNPNLKFSLMVEGALNDEMAAIVYERFAGISSQFLGCEVDFLGWIDKEQVCMNHELLLETDIRGKFIREPMKAKLVHLLSEELMLQTV
ncbi:MAG: hypothetical protein COV74_08880 [Candidatus Omnitrophica bacterium CG11_big_fil_rev_8_21_14_0_20_45_26]|uniref:Uncharacterized protein n=1 Tax=Candidatus Abzuiibacterium crystallinum TaxID=1974748 RepID=A0A2H0LM06_9BACT|nr:MAG: hypothetical protein COV74_08880 [Candidatus Omnitrophica bacterium CG11_big_fil_rev_8_21_14_0_20_45_26]PIW64430.1 MAG: hypothetical protein COW12_06225 [Candidatus Omnitrophica bacterium CG12_big_fil_rev_8_21_14_0_65_45_16]